MTGRPILGLLMTAALLGAPSSAFAAGNELYDPAITPTSGSTATVFTVSVGYDGRFEATAFTAEVAGLLLPMPEATEGGGPVLDGAFLSMPTGEVEPASDAAGGGAATDGFVPGMLLAGLGTLAGVTLIGAPVLVAVRRRRTPREKEAPPAAAEATAATLRRRTLRRAKMRLDDDDPILVSMGFGSSEADRAAGRKHGASGQRPDRTPPT